MTDVTFYEDVDPETVIEERDVPMPVDEDEWEDDRINSAALADGDEEPQKDS